MAQRKSHPTLSGITGSVVIGLALLVGCMPGEPEAEGPRMTIYEVVQIGSTAEGASRLAGSLAIESELDAKRSGVLSHVDPDRFQELPTIAMGGGEGDEDGSKDVVLEAIDRDALAKLSPLEADDAEKRFAEALRDAGLHPDDEVADAEVVVRHAEFEVFDEYGERVTAARLDTQVDYLVSYGGIPLKGPGARVTATFDGEGRVTQLRHALRSVKKGESVPIISAEAAQSRCSELLAKGGSDVAMEELRLSVELVYYAPDLSYRDASVILPHYECGGTAVVGDERIHLLRRFVPAVEDARYMPKVTVSAEGKDAEVTARAEVSGGQPPYRFDWSSSSTAIAGSGGEVSYAVAAREEGGLESVQVAVSDANGVLAYAAVAVQISGTLVAFPISFDDPDVDFGTENSVTNEFGDLEQGFINEMIAGSVTERFSWSGTAAWERDFKAPWDNQATPYPGVDQADIVFYVGHGYGGGFTFEDSTHQDSTLSSTDADGDWGNRDSEWMALYSCQVLKDEYGGLSTVERWKDEFDGLHLLMGFHTNAYVRSGFSGAFADNMLNNGMTIRQAWFSAVQSDQPSGVTAVVMGPLRASDWVNNYNDYFHLRGTQGPDLRGAGLLFWKVSYTRP